MKNLYQYSAEEHPTKFVWDKFNEAKGQASASEVSDGKEALTTKISKELDELANDIKLSDTLDKDKILAKINEGGSDSEKYVQRTDGTMILKDRVNKEKVKITAGNVLKIKDRKGDEILKVDLNTNDVKKNVGFGIEKKEETPETDASKEFKKKIETLDGNIEDMQEEDLVSLEGKIRNLRTEIKDNTELTAKERAHLLGLLTSLTARIVARRNVLKPNNNVEVVSDTMKEYEAKIAGFESRLSGAEGKALEDLIDEAEALRKEINNPNEKKLTAEEKKTLTARIDSLIKNIEKKQNDLENDKKRETAEQSLKDAQRLIDVIDLTDLGISNYQKFSTPIEAARQAIKKADDLTKENFPDLAEKIPGLEAQLDKKENQVELYKTGATEKENVEKEYQEKTDEQLTAMDKEIKDKVDAYTKELEGKEKKLENLTLSSLTIDQTKEPQSYEEIQQGMQAHRLDSMMMLEEVNFLQDCGQKFAEEIAEFEEEKSAFTMPNIARSLVASIAIVPGLAWDLGEWALGTGKRAGDRFGWLGFGNSRAEELQKKQVQFETDFTVKQGELEGKKTALDEYGKKLQYNSKSLKTTAPEEVKTNIKKSIEDQLLGKGLDINDDPWKEIHRKLTEEFEDTAENKVKPAVDQLYMMVDGSVPELTDATDLSLKAASDTSDYIKDLDVHSATVLDMSVGFLTKNVAKGLDGVGDVLAMNPITGVLGGVCRAAGGLVEGVGTLITDPDKVWDGLKTLGGADGWKEAGEAWAGMGSAFLGGEAWKTAAAAWKSGDYWKALSEGTAAVGEGGGNVLATFFTGGVSAGARGVGMVSRITSMTGKVGTGVMKFARVTRTTKAVLATRKFAIKSGEIGAKIGNVALAPLKYGLKPLRMFGKIGRKAEAITSRVFTPTKWAKLKPGSAAAEKAANKLVNKGAKLDGEIKALQNKIKGTKDAFERKVLTKDMVYLRLKRMRLNKEINSLLGEKTIVAPKSKVTLETAAPKITLKQADANIARINRRIKAGPGPKLSSAEKAARSAALEAELKAAIAERSSLLVPGSAEAMTRVAEIDVNIARINRRVVAGPGKTLSTAEKAARSAALDAELKAALAEKSSLLAPGSTEAMTRAAEIQTEIARINRRIAAGPGASLTPAEKVARAAALDVELNSATSEMARLTTMPIRIPGSAEAMTRVAEIDVNIARINRRIKAGPGPKLSPAEKAARSAALEAELTTAIAERSSLLVPGSAEAMTRVAEIQANIARINRRIAAGPGASLTPAEQAARAAALDAELNRSVAEMARLTTMPIPFTPISLPVATGTANGGIVSGVMAASAIPLSYNAVEIEKNKITNIKENVPAKTEFERTPLADLDGSPASVNGAPASGPQQTVDQIKLDFEQTNEGRFRAFFNTGVSNVDRSTIKSLVKADLASDAEITIDGVVSQNGIEDVWNLFDPNKVGAVLTKLESKKEGTKNVISKIIIDKAK